ncbi:MAG: hypothetical protein OEL83_05705 [Desulforhopalus sp.]|nr:hypothetical protein [Desulforhopalus sp.]
MTINDSLTPAFIVKAHEEHFNRIGSPGVRTIAEDTIDIFVDPENPVLFFESQEFTTAKDRYTNLIYRVHFPEVPLGWSSINLTGGKNPGILIIYTLNSAGNLLLVTTVHTCGCYLAFFPTTATPHDALPKDWPTTSQLVYGYTLPSRLDFRNQDAANRIAFTLESETHRIGDVAVITPKDQHAIQHQVTMRLKAMLDLHALPYQNKTLSFFESDGPRRGYVRNNTKILERLLISWWAFDLYVGEDKAFSSHDTSDTVFYTSLKFWARQASNLKDFPKFLEYWGWNL